MLYNLLEPNCISKTGFIFLFIDHPLESQHPRVGNKHFQNVTRVKFFIAHLMKNLQFMRVLIKVSGMHLYKIPFQCNIHSKLQTNSSALCFLDKHSGSRATEGQFHLQSLARAWCWRMRFPRKWEYGSSQLLLSPGFLLSSYTRKHRGKNPTSLGTQGRGSHACSSCRLLCFFTATEELSLGPKSVIPHKSLASSHIRADW